MRIRHGKKYWACLSLALFCTGFISSCSSTNTIDKGGTPANLPSTSGSELRTYLGHLDRLDRVAARLFQSSTDICQRIGRDPGIITHSYSQFPRKARKTAKVELGVSKAPIVILVRENGSASALKLGDILLGQNDQPIVANSKDVQAYLAAGFLRIQRDGQEKFIPVSAPRACAYRVHVKMDTKISARISGGQITISSGLLKLAKTDSELAFVLGHELAHGIKNHIQQAINNGGLLGLANKKMRALETEADYVGLNLVAAAGYDMTGAELFWQRMIDADPQNRTKSHRHPTRKQRLDAISAFAQRIKQKLNQGQSLTQMQKPPS